MGVGPPSRPKVAAERRKRKRMCETVWVKNLKIGQRMARPSWKYNIHVQYMRHVHMIYPKKGER